MRRIIILLILLLYLPGCSFLTEITPETPLGLDPNTVSEIAGDAQAVGTALMTTGTTLGQPAIIGSGILLATLGGAILALKKRKTK